MRRVYSPEQVESCLPQKIQYYREKEERCKREEREWLSLEAGDRSPYPLDVIDLVSTRLLLSYILKALDVANLSTRERKVLWGVFFEDQTYEQIGNEIGASREGVRQIRARALEELRRKDIKRVLSDLLY